jgi:hypothetical protein
MPDEYLLTCGQRRGYLSTFFQVQLVVERMEESYAIV